MKSLVLILTALIFFTLIAHGQDFFFIDEKSYPCTEAFTLDSNSEDSDKDDLKVLLGKDGSTAVFIVSTKKLFAPRISGKLIIYLDDGMVISCDDAMVSDYVDNIASSVYHLTEEDLIKMQNSNINTVRYMLFWEDIGTSNHSASNKGSSRIDFPAIITEFFKE